MGVLAVYGNALVKKRECFKARAFTNFLKGVILYE